MLLQCCSLSSFFWLPGGQGTPAQSTGVTKAWSWLTRCPASRGKMQFRNCLILRGRHHYSHSMKIPHTSATGLFSGIPHNNNSFVLFSSASHSFTAAFQMGHLGDPFFTTLMLLKSFWNQSFWSQNYSNTVFFKLLFLSWLPKQQTKAIASKTHYSLEYVMQYSSSQMLERSSHRIVPWLLRFMCQ